MILEIVGTALLVYTVGGLLGYAVHWMFHQSWSGPLYRLHRMHHDRLYPAGDFLSDVYRGAGVNNTAPWFTAILVAVLAPAFLALWKLGVPGGLILFAAAESTAIGMANNWVHDSLHIRGHFLERFRAFRVWRTAHRVHHANVATNLGIFTFGWDKIFGTFRKPHVNE